MPRGKINTTNLNTRRLELLSKGYLNKKELSQFVPCGINRAGEVFEDIRRSVKKKGFENCRDVILAGRVLDYFDLTMSGIRAAAKDEKERT